MPALLPYLPAMMLPLVRLDESSHSSTAADASLPTHLAEVNLQVALMVPDLLMRNGVPAREILESGGCKSSVISTSDLEGVPSTGSGLRYRVGRAFGCPVYDGSPWRMLCLCAG